MKVWMLGSVESMYLLRNQEDYLKYIVDSFKGSSVSDNWYPVSIINQERHQKKYDFSSVGFSFPVVSEAAIQVLNEIVEDKVEFLPVAHETESLFALNITNLLDCIDFDQADVVLHEKYKVVDDIKSYAFKLDMIAEETIFKIPQFKGNTRIFVTDKFRDKVLEANLTGFEFEELWDSDNPYDKRQQVPLEEIQHTGQEVSFGEALELIKNNEQAVANDRWKLQKNTDGQTILGYLTVDGVYDWTLPVFFPPTFVDMKWYVVEKS